jgi:HD-like signal output (HDOD) protein
MNRLLFVDDEPRVLQGLRQSLRGKRKVWDMVFAEGPTSALAELEQGRFDAIISDMRMPVMDGAELLNRARLLQPDALRIVLSGQMDESTAARAAKSAHRFLAKPCDSEVLAATLSRALDLRAKLNSSAMRECLGGMASLPSLPKSCALLNRALEDDNVSIEQVTRVIEGDVGMASKTLQLVNSAFFGLSRSLTGVGPAVNYLGLNAMRSLVLAEALFHELAGSDVQLLEAAQARSLLAAKYARRFTLDRRQSDIAGTAALLHNAGCLALISLGADQPKPICQHASKDSSSVGAEPEGLGVTCAELGAYLLGLWGLPHEVIEAVGTQAEPLEGRAALDAGAVVHIVTVLVAEAWGEGSKEPGRLAPEFLERWKVTDVVSGIRAEIASSPRK